MSAAKSNNIIYSFTLSNFLIRCNSAKKLSRVYPEMFCKKQIQVFSILKKNETVDVLYHFANVKKQDNWPARFSL